MRLGKFLNPHGFNTETELSGANQMISLSPRRPSYYGPEPCILASSVDLETSPMTSNSDKEVKIETLSKDCKGKTTNSKKNSKDKPTRVRTVLNEKQLSTLKRCYAANPRPDSVMKEQLVDLTGLSSRVIRVWFQNKRCKDKKKMMLNGGDAGKIGVSFLAEPYFIRPSCFFKVMINQSGDAIKSEKLKARKYENAIK